MRKRLTVAVLLGLLWVGRLWAQQVPAAVVADPPADKQHPPGLAILTVPSTGVELDAWLYVASGAGPHGTVILAHGLPGYESNGDLAQSIRRAGWNVLLFHYRGTWGVPGAFSQSSAIKDTAEIVRFLREPANVIKYHLDPTRLVLIGHSFGGFIAGYEAAHDPGIEAVAMIAAVNLGKINADPKEREARLKRWETQLHPVRGATAAQLFAEAEQHAKDWDYVQWADALRIRPILLVEADDQNHADMEALATALHQKGAVALEQRAVATDHSFSDRRLELQTIVIHWLEKLRVNSPTNTPTQVHVASPESEVRQMLRNFVRPLTISTGKLSGWRSPIVRLCFIPAPFPSGPAGELNLKRGSKRFSTRFGPEEPHRRIWTFSRKAWTFRYFVMSRLRASIWTTGLDFSIDERLC